MSELRIVTGSINEIGTIIIESQKVLLEEVVKQICDAQNQKKEILTRKAAAELLDISYPCMYDWIENGCLKPYKMGNRTYFKYSEVMETLFNSNKAG